MYKDLTNAKHVMVYAGLHIRILRDDTVRYRYPAPGQPPEHYTEVAELHKVSILYGATFKKMLYQFNAVIDYIPHTLTEYPWLADRLIGYRTPEGSVHQTVVQEISTV